MHVDRWLAVIMLPGLWLVSLKDMVEGDLPLEAQGQETRSTAGGCSSACPLAHTGALAIARRCKSSDDPCLMAGAHGQ